MISTHSLLNIINNDNVETSAHDKTQYKKLLMNVPPSTTINPGFALCSAHRCYISALCSSFSTSAPRLGNTGSTQYSGYIEGLHLFIHSGDNAMFSDVVWPPPTLHCIVLVHGTWYASSGFGQFLMINRKIMFCKYFLRILYIV